MRVLITGGSGFIDSHLVDQEETTAPPIRKPVIVLRLSTGRLEAVDADFAKVVDTENDNILAAINKIFMRKVKLPAKSPFGDGDAGEKMLESWRKS